MPAKLGSWTKSTRFGPQPAIDIINQRRIKVAHLAAALGMSYPRLNNILHGTTMPIPRETNKLAAELGVAPHEVFTHEARYAGGEDL